MLIIRDEQKRILAEHLVDKYREHAFEHVCKRYPKEVERRGEAAIKSLIDRALEKAHRYGLVHSPDVTGLLSLMIVYGEDFEVERPRLAQVLLSPLDPAEKIATVIEDLLADLDARAAKRKAKFEVETL